MCREAGVVIRYGAKFEGFVREDETEGEGVEFLINGRKEKASMVVGADGIYSSVRGFVAPGVVPECECHTSLVISRGGEDCADSSQILELWACSVISGGTRLRGLTRTTKPMQRSKANLELFSGLLKIPRLRTL